MRCARCGGCVLRDYDGEASCLHCGEVVYRPWARLPAAVVPADRKRGRGGPMLTGAEVAAIQQATARPVDLAAQYGVSLSTVRVVRNGQYGPGRDGRPA